MRRVSSKAVYEGAGVGDGDVFDASREARKELNGEAGEDPPKSNISVEGFSDEPVGGEGPMLGTCC